ncbi:MAG TPA: DUF4157 domain-containing protein [Allosphingosinicella sp.]|nr:DUF4157 domain-containing protein [Allosphingosinicella sp.]
MSPRYGFAQASPRFGLAEGRSAPAAPTASRADGLPEPLKTNMEAMSGVALDDVKVHRNSSKPAALDALAYAQGSDIHLGAGQEEHLPHEAWHVVQQKQGRVPATRQLKGVSLNADSALEREADAMGSRAAAADPAPGIAAAALRRASASGPAVVQREATKEEKELLRARVGEAFGTYEFQQRENVEFAMGLRDFYQLIRPKSGKPYWRRKSIRRSGGRGFYGRLADKPPTMQELADAKALFDAIQSAPAKFFKHFTFVAETSLGKRKSNNSVMGKHFLGKGEMPASIYALTGDCEWLHMQGHGLGGSETPANLFAGSNNANSHMAAVETAVQVLRTLPKTQVDVEVSIQLDEDYHTPETCTKIAGALNLDPGTVYASMAKLESRKPEYIRYTVLIDNKTVWSEGIPALSAGRFDEGLFKKLQSAVIASVKPKLEPIKFVKGETLNPSSSSASALSSAPSSSSSSASFSSTSSSSSDSAFASSSSSSSSSMMSD